MIIFLDIDGVLNQLQPGYYLDKTCIQNLSILTKRLQAEVVLTSTWRLGYMHNRERCTPQVQKLLELFDEVGIVVQSRTKKLGDRKTEIEAYLEENEVTEYLVLDDDKREFPFGVPDNFYLVDGRLGLTKKDVQCILKR